MERDWLDYVLAAVQIITLIALIVYVWKTWEMASATRKSSEAAEKTLHEMKTARNEESAPYVVAYLDIPYGEHFIYFIVKNIGRTTAENVSLQFTPALRNSNGSDIATIGFIKDGIPSLPPGHEIRTVVDGSAAYLGKAELPKSYELRIAYSDSITNTARALTQRLDLNPYWNRQSIVRLQMHDLATSVEKIANGIRKNNEYVASIDSRLSEGVLSSDATLDVDSLVGDRRNWARVVSTKFNEFRVTWGKLYRSSENSEYEFTVTDVQRQARITGEQILTLVAAGQDFSKPEDLERLASIAASLVFLGRKRIYADGGQSIKAIEELGDRLCNEMAAISQEAGFLKAENEEIESGMVK